jgi:hypothetical protein
MIASVIQCCQKWCVQTDGIVRRKLGLEPLSVMQYVDRFISKQTDKVLEQAEHYAIKRFDHEIQILFNWFNLMSVVGLSLYDSSKSSDKSAQGQLKTFTQSAVLQGGGLILGYSVTERVKQYLSQGSPMAKQLQRQSLAWLKKLRLYSYSTTGMLELIGQLIVASVVYLIGKWALNLFSGKSPVADLSNGNTAGQSHKKSLRTVNAFTRFE